MRCHEIDYEIHGATMQMVEIELDPQETVIAEAGAMNYMEDGIEFETKMGDGSDADQGFMSKLFSAGKRVISRDGTCVGVGRSRFSKVLRTSLLRHVPG